jgi:Lysophospholipase
MWKWETENEPKGVVVIVHDLLEHHEYYDELTVKLAVTAIMSLSETCRDTVRQRV